MRRRSAMVCCCFLLVLGFTTDTASATTGNDLLALPEYPRTTYVVGVIDAWGEVGTLIRQTKDPSPELAVIDRMFGDLARCAVGRKMTRAQVGAIVDKFLKDNPAKWHDSAGSLIWEAFTDVCR